MRITSIIFTGILFSIVFLLTSNVAIAQESDQAEAEESLKDDPVPQVDPNAMTLDRLHAIIQKVDAEAKREGNSWQFTIAKRPMIVVSDPNADRMRIITPIANASALDAAMLERLMQANYDAALDARYALGQGLLWGVFIHPLSSLKERDFLSGLGQTVNVALSFGGSFTSGMFVYGGGDSNALHQEILDELMKKQEETI